MHVFFFSFSPSSFLCLGRLLEFDHLFSLSWPQPKHQASHDHDQCFLAHQSRNSKQNVIKTARLSLVLTFSRQLRPPACSLNPIHFNGCAAQWQFVVPSKTHDQCVSRGVVCFLWRILVHPDTGGWLWRGLQSLRHRCSYEECLITSWRSISAKNQHVALIRSSCSGRFNIW